MKRNIGFVLAIFIAVPALVPGQPLAPPAAKALPVLLRPQETNMWCWAASGQMVMQFLGKNVDQCDEANKRFGLITCCDAPTAAACVLDRKSVV